MARAVIRSRDIVAPVPRIDRCLSGREGHTGEVEHRAINIQLTSVRPKCAEAVTNDGRTGHHRRGIRQNRRAAAENLCESRTRR